MENECYKKRFCRIETRETLIKVYHRERAKNTRWREPSPAQNNNNIPMHLPRPCQSFAYQISYFNYATFPRVQMARRRRPPLLVYEYDVVSGFSQMYDEGTLPSPFFTNATLRSNSSHSLAHPPPLREVHEVKAQRPTRDEGSGDECQASHHRTGGRKEKRCRAKPLFGVFTP